MFVKNSYVRNINCRHEIWEKILDAYEEAAPATSRQPKKGHKILQYPFDLDSFRSGKDDFAADQIMKFIKKGIDRAIESLTGVKPADNKELPRRSQAIIELAINHGTRGLPLGEESKVMWEGWIGAVAAVLEVLDADVNN